MFQVERKNKCDMIYVFTTHICAVTNKHVVTSLSLDKLCQRLRMTLSFFIIILTIIFAI